MKRLWTIIGVRDAASSFVCYRTLLGLPETVPEHDFFGQIVDQDGTVLLCLHSWRAHDHSSLERPENTEQGNGLLLFFVSIILILAFQKREGLSMSSRKNRI